MNPYDKYSMYVGDVNIEHGGRFYRHDPKFGSVDVVKTCDVHPERHERDEVFAILLIERGEFDTDSIEPEVLAAYIGCDQPGKLRPVDLWDAHVSYWGCNEETLYRVVEYYDRPTEIFDANGERIAKLEDYDDLLPWMIERGLLEGFE